jgi:hypothetical protein
MPDIERPDIQAQDERATINTIMNRIARRRLGPQATDDTAFGRGIQNLWNEVKPTVGIPLAQEFGKVDDLKVLAYLKRYVIALEQREKRMYGTANGP